MLKYYSDIFEIEFILNTLRDEDKEELEHLFGAEWKKKAAEQLKDEKFLVLYGNCGQEGRKPIAMGGFYEIKQPDAAISFSDEAALSPLETASSLTSPSLAEASSLSPSPLETASSLTPPPLAEASSLTPSPLAGEGWGGGLTKRNQNRIACVWLLTSKYVKQNKTALMRALREQLYSKGAEYDILYNFIYKSNHQAKLRLKKLGFSFNNPKPASMNVTEGFEFFYKVI